MEIKKKFEILSEYLVELAKLRKAYELEEKEGPASFVKTHVKILEGNGLHSFYGAHQGTIHALRISKSISRVDNAGELYSSKEISWIDYRHLIEQWCSYVLDIMDSVNLASHDVSKTRVPILCA